MLTGGSLPSGDRDSERDHPLVSLQPGRRRRRGTSHRRSTPSALPADQRRAVGREDDVAPCRCVPAVWRAVRRSRGPTGTRSVPAPETGGRLRHERSSREFLDDRAAPRSITCCPVPGSHSFTVWSAQRRRTPKVLPSGAKATERVLGVSSGLACLTASGVPEVDDVAVAARGEAFAIGRESDPRDHVDMPLQCGDALARAEVPEADRRIFAPRTGSRAVRSEGQAGDGVLMALEWRRRFGDAGSRSRRRSTGQNGRRDRWCRPPVDVAGTPTSVELC